MHFTAVLALTLLVAWFVLGDLRELFIAWYSGIDPPLSSATVVLICGRALVAIAAGTLAFLTL